MMTPEEIQAARDRAKELIAQVRDKELQNALKYRVNELISYVREKSDPTEATNAQHDLRLILGLDREAEKKELHDVWFKVSEGLGSTIRELRAEIERLKGENAQLLVRPDELVSECERIQSQFMAMDLHAVELKAENDQLKAQVEELRKLRNDLIDTIANSQPTTINEVKSVLRNLHDIMDRVSRILVRQEPDKDN